MTNRRPRNEFPKRVKTAAWDRCDGHCEDCGAKLYPGRYTYDHDQPDALGGDNSLENCKVRCAACDKSKTAKDQGVIAKSRRIQEKHLGIRKPAQRPIPGSRNSRWKKKMNGEVVRR